MNTPHRRVAVFGERTAHRLRMLGPRPWEHDKGDLEITSLGNGKFRVSWTRAYDMRILAQTSPAIGGTGHAAVLRAIRLAKERGALSGDERRKRKRRASIAKEKLRRSRVAMKQKRNSLGMFA